MKANILIVDDTPENLHLLIEMLSEQRYNVRAASNGHRALATAQEELPDLILLDIIMPGMNGYEVCEQLKADEHTRDIPVVFISSLNGKFDKVKAFSVGAVDYITKPFQTEEVLARVENHLSLRRLQIRLQEHNIRLQQEIVERKRAEAALQQANEVLQHRNRELAQTLEHIKAMQQQLVESEKMAALGQLVAGVAHEINTPLGIDVTAASFLEEKTRELAEAYKAGTLEQSDLEIYIQLAMKADSIILSNLKRVVELIHHFKQVAVDQISEEHRRFKLKDCFDDILVCFHSRYKPAKHTITVTCPDTLSLESYPGAFEQVITYLLENSLLHGFDHLDQGHITIEVMSHEKELLIRYSDDGQGMDQEQCAKIFEPFFTTKRARGRTGLGLHIVYNLVTQKLQGRIHCESQVGVGTTFLLNLPLSLADPTQAGVQKLSHSAHPGGEVREENYAYQC